MSLNAKNAGIAGGILIGASLCLLTLFSAATGFANEVLTIVKGLYPGYSISVIGSMFGLIYGFIDGFLGSYIFVWIYNKLNQ